MTAYRMIAAAALFAVPFDVSRINGSHEERRNRASKTPRKDHIRGNGRATDPHSVHEHYKLAAQQKRMNRAAVKIGNVDNGGYHYARV